MGQILKQDRGHGITFMYFKYPNAQEAKKTTIFTISRTGEIVEENLFDFITGFIPETTTPKGVGPSYRINDITEWRSDNEEPERQFNAYQCFCGRWNKVAEFTGEQAEEEAEQYLFDIAYSHFNDGFDRYFSTKEDAREELIQIITDGDRPCTRIVAERYLSIREARRKRELHEHEIFLENERARKKANYEAAEIYAKLIRMIPGESYKETANRLSVALLGTRLPSQTFHASVKLIRKA